MFVRWVEHFLWGAPEFGARKLSSYMFVARFLLTSSPYRVLLSTLHKGTSCSLTSICPVESRKTSVSGHSAHVHKILGLQFSLVILNNKECLCLVIRRLLSALFIYLFFKNFSIHSISYEPFNYVTCREAVGVFCIPSSLLHCILKHYNI